MATSDAQDKLKTNFWRLRRRRPKRDVAAVWVGGRKKAKNAAVNLEREKKSRLKHPQREEKWRES